MTTKPLKEALNYVDSQAVERIDNHTYGICDGCGSQIGTKRLEARPVTDLCIECKTRQEEEERITEG